MVHLSFVAQQATYLRLGGEIMLAVGLRHASLECMTVELPRANEQFEAHLVQDLYGVLWLQEATPGPDRRAAQVFSLVVVLKLGWRLVRPSPDEQALLQKTGFCGGWIQ
jgi:hypothetical protein